MHKDHVFFIKWPQMGIYLLGRVLGFTSSLGIAAKPIQDIDGVKTKMGLLWRPVLRDHKRNFDGHNIMSITKAVLNLKELELMGTSDDTIVRLFAPS
jgi:hypothetical protein